MCTSYRNNDIALIDMKRITPQIPETIDSCKRNQNWIERKVKFEYIDKGYHSGDISSLDVCL